MIPLIKRNWINIIFFLIIGFMIYQRLPSWIEAWKLQGQTAPTIEVQDMNGQIKRIPDDLPKPGALIFWATWCGPCTIELSRVRDLVQEKQIDPNIIRAISVGEERDLVMKVSTDRQYNFPILVDQKGSSTGLYKVYATPTVVILNTQGEIDWVGTGLSPTLTYRLKKLMDSK